MSFDVLETVTKFNKPIEASISYMRPKRKGEHKKGAKPSLIIAVPTSLSGISKKKFFLLKIGSKENAGKARIVGQNTPNGQTIERRDMVYSTVFNFGYVPGLGDDIAGKEFVAVKKMSDDEFEIALPPWFTVAGLK